MIGLSLVLLLGGAPWSPAAEPASDPAQALLRPAIVVPADAFEGEAGQDEPEAPEAGPAPAAPPVTLRQATILRPSAPTKEHE